MVDLLRSAELRSILDRHGLDARRSLGQNFVVDPSTVEQIAAWSGVGPDRPAVEVGPGLGSLTLALAATGADVLAVEKDAALVQVLAELLPAHGAPGVRVVEGDALEVDWSELLAGPPGPWTLVANLPYNVAVPIVMRLLQSVPEVQRLVVMVQLEVAERLAAGPGGRVVGVPSIKVAWYGSAEVLGRVPPEVFVPPPRVESAVVRIDRRPPPSGAVRPGEVFRLVETAYRQRRKMLRSTLAAVVAPEAFDQSGVAPTARPEELGVGQWAALAEAAAGRGAGPLP
jgi:16S rRNA (adenine1518-N6/adenine1519-N6)-dimethyltransferase